MSPSLFQFIKYYQRSIDTARNANDGVRLLHCIGRLRSLPVHLKDLQDTGIGKTVNSLRNNQGEVGIAAKRLVAQWTLVMDTEREHPVRVKDTIDKHSGPRGRVRQQNYPQKGNDFKISFKHTLRPAFVQKEMYMIRMPTDFSEENYGFRMKNTPLIDKRKITDTDSKMRNAAMEPEDSSEHVKRHRPEGKIAKLSSTPPLQAPTVQPFIALPLTLELQLISQHSTGYKASDGNGISSIAAKSPGPGIKRDADQQIPSLFNLCVRTLQKHIDDFEYTGGVPFDVLRPVLEHATPNQLLHFESYNPYIRNDSNVLWQEYCARFYECYDREGHETWRQKYFLCSDQELGNLFWMSRPKKELQRWARPVRRLQLAFIHDEVKPPLEIRRKQQLFGTGSKLVATPAARVASLRAIIPNAVRAGDPRLKFDAGLHAEIPKKIARSAKPSRTVKPF